VSGYDSDNFSWRQGTCYIVGEVLHEALLVEASDGSGRGVDGKNVFGILDCAGSMTDHWIYNLRLHWFELPSDNQFTHNNTDPALSNPPVAAPAYHGESVKMRSSLF
jgi:hypothetical protein